MAPADLRTSATEVGSQAVLDVTRFPVDGKNGTALLSAQGLPGGHVYLFPLVRRHRTRNGVGNPVTELRRSFPVGKRPLVSDHAIWPSCGWSL
jgi:hypothetical protein